MKRTAFIGAIAALLVSLSPSNAEPSEDGSEALSAITAHTRGDFKSAMEAGLPLARRGNREAQWLVGSMYLMGEAVPENDEEAVHWFRECSGYNFDCQVSLGLCYMAGTSVPRDYATASWWFRKAAEQGAGWGRTSAQSGLGGLYERGGPGLKQDLVKAWMWYHLAYGVDTPRVNNMNNRNSVDSQLEPKMTQQQIAEAKDLVKRCIAQNYQACGDLTVEGSQK